MMAYTKPQEMGEKKGKEIRSSLLVLDLKDGRL